MRKVYLYLCIERSEVRVTVCVIVFNVIVCVCVIDDEGKGAAETLAGTWSTLVNKCQGNHHLNVYDPHHFPLSD